jgi:hypothetical protein
MESECLVTQRSQLGQFNSITYKPRKNRHGFCKKSLNLDKIWEDIVIREEGSGTQVPLEGRCM